MVSNAAMEAVISIDKRGVIEYWDMSTGRLPSPDTIHFQLKAETDLYDLAKAKTAPIALALAPSGLVFATLSSDKSIRIFDFKQGKLLRKYDESLAAYSANDGMTAGRDMMMLIHGSNYILDGLIYAHCVLSDNVLYINKFDQASIASTSVVGKPLKKSWTHHWSRCLSAPWCSTTAATSSCSVA